MSEGDIPSRSMVIKKGIISAYILTSDGEIKPVGLHLPGDVFPIPWTFGRARNAQYFYEAFNDTKIYLVPREEYIDFVLTNHDVLVLRFRRMVDKYISSMMRIGVLEYSKAGQKLLHFLHYLCIYYGRELKNHTIEIQLPLTQQELANFLGLTRETTGIELKKLERSGIIKRRNGKYIIRTDKLNYQLDEEYDLRRSDSDQAQQLT